jgi:pseudoazurin
MLFGRRLLSCGMAVTLATMGLPASAAEHVVNAEVTSWNPMVVYVQSGDTVKWENMAGHNSESIDGFIPEGAAKWQSVLGEAASQTFEVPGAYIYKCAPHFSTGMVGVVVVGDGRPANLDAIKDHPDNKGMIARTVRKLVKELEAKGIQ